MDCLAVDAALVFWLRKIQIGLYSEYFPLGTLQSKLIKIGANVIRPACLSNFYWRRSLCPELKKIDRLRLFRETG